jgi:hypothetical protein
MKIPDDEFGGDENGIYYDGQNKYTRLCGDLHSRVMLTRGFDTSAANLAQC